MTFCSTERDVRDERAEIAGPTVLFFIITKYTYLFVILSLGALRMKAFCNDKLRDKREQ